MTGGLAGTPRPDLDLVGATPALQPVACRGLGHGVAKER